VPTSAKTALLYKGAAFPTSVPVVHGGDIKRAAGGTCWWKLPSKHLRTRRDEIRAIVLHHTAGEGNGTAVFNTLVKRGLSVHFTIDANGRVIQHADVHDVTFHAGDANGWSVGIEVVNRGIPPELPRAKRDIITQTVHGKKRPMLAFYPEQIIATRYLVHDLCSLLQLPVSVPLTSDGVMWTTVLPSAVLAAHRGVLGHFHLTAKKIDPVPHLLEAMR
jgi:hypothetical protein